MKILLVVDGSSYSDIATKTLEALSLPPQTKVIVMTVIPEHTFLGEINLGTLKGRDAAKKKAQSDKAAELLQNPVQRLSTSGLKVESLIQWGNPAQEILAIADKSGASLIVMGAKGLTSYPAFRLGSVSQKVIKYTSASVLLVRKKAIRANRSLQSEETSVTIDRVLFATDGSKYSDMASQFLIDLPLPIHSHVIVVSALQSYKMGGISYIDIETDRELLADLQEDEERAAQQIIAKSSQKLNEKGYRTTSEILRGDAGGSILKAADEHDPDIITLGSRGLSGIESFLLGSVSERVVRHALCSVLIVKSPKA